MSKIDEKIYGPEGELFQLLHRISRLRLSLIFENLTHMEFVTMATIEKCRGNEKLQKVKTSDIAHAANVHSSAVSRTLSTLENKGYIRRTIDNTDRRNTYIELTEDGRKTLEQCSMVIEGFIKSVFDKVGEENINQFITILRKIHDVSQDELELRNKQRSDI